MPITCLGTMPPQHHGDDPAFVPGRRRHEVVARGAGITGLDPVDPVNPSEQLVVVAIGASAIAEVGGREIGVEGGMVGHDRPGEPGHVAGRGDLFRMMQAGGVAELCLAHADELRLDGHQCSETRFGSGNVFPDHDRHIVRRLGDQGFNGVPGRDRGARLQAQPRGRLAGRFAGDGHGGVEREPASRNLVEQHVEGHDLGQRGRMARRIGMPRMQDRSGLLIDHDGGIFLCGGRRRDGQGAKQQRQDQQQVAECRHRDGKSGHDMVHDRRKAALPCRLRVNFVVSD